MDTNKMRGTSCEDGSRQRESSLRSWIGFGWSGWGLVVVATTLVAMGGPSIAQEAGAPCAGMAYENGNQVDYGPLRVGSSIRGTAGDPQDVRVPGVCVGLFTPDDHRLVAAVQTDSEGRFEFRGVPKGEYRLVASYPGFCPGNARIRVKPGYRSKKHLKLMLEIGELDSCSYFHLE